MPELPEVQALAEFVAERAVGHAVSRLDVVAISALKTFDPPPTALVGREIAGTRRYGKFLAIETAAGGSDGSLYFITHLARAGWLRWKDELPAAPPKPGRGGLAVRMHVSDVGGFDLTEAGTKKKLACYVVRSPDEVPGIARLGPDPLDPSFTREVLAGLLASRRTQIKGVLRDQSVIAGIGNAYSDEVLHAAKLSPFKLAATLTGAEIDQLYAATAAVLTDAVERSRGLAAGDLKAEKKSGLRVHARTGETCDVCGDTIREVSFADSFLNYCPTCQTAGKPLADRRLSRLVK